MTTAPRLPGVVYVVTYTAPWWKQSNWVRRWYIRRHDAVRRADELAATGHRVRLDECAVEPTGGTDLAPGVDRHTGQRLAAQRAERTADVFAAIAADLDDNWDSPF